MNCTPILVVQDVEASSLWYRQVLGFSGAHGGAEFEMLMAGDRLLLMLHHVAFEEHPAMTDPRSGDPGLGVLLHVSVDDVQAVFERAKQLGADLLDEPHFNPKARAVEFSLRDLDGYAITVSKRRG